ncbi:MAG: ABC transporter permease subunit [Candidatus Pacebacteria bacterium]|nr:ABC transporter permease subunit [Candidatus Paceibacterota bacterium]
MSDSTNTEAATAPNSGAKKKNFLVRIISNNSKWLMIAPPLYYMVFLFLIPFLLALKISFADSILAVPPFTAIYEYKDDHLLLNLSLLNFQALGHDVVTYKNELIYNFGNLVGWIGGLFSSAPAVVTEVVAPEPSQYLSAFVESLRLATIATIVCLLIGYPVAYAIARAPKSRQNIYIMLVILPFWTSFLLRVYALQGVLRDSGLLNQLLIFMGFIDEPIHILQTSLAVQIGIAYSYAPFMVLPLYATLQKLDPALLEAASDLGSRPFRAFLDVTLPLSMPGVIAGSMLTFIPAMGEYIIPDMLGGPGVQTIGRVLWDTFFNDRDWPMAAAVSIAFLLFLVVPIGIYQYYSIREREA